MPQCIYIITNQAFSDIVKIGYSTNPTQRVASLSRTMPKPFKLEYYIQVIDGGKDLEKAIHRVFKQLNRQKSDIDATGREWFESDVQFAIEVIEKMASALMLEVINKFHIVNMATARQGTQQTLFESPAQQEQQPTIEDSQPMIGFNESEKEREEAINNNLNLSPKLIRTAQVANYDDLIKIQEQIRQRTTSICPTCYNVVSRPQVIVSELRCAKCNSVVF